MTADEDMRQLFDAYIEERRAAPIPGFEVEVLPRFTRYLPASGEGEGMVMYARMDDDEAARHVEEQSRFFASRGLALEWKVYDFDRPANLKALLEASGFAAHHHEVFMMRDIGDEHAGPHLPGGVEIRAASAGNTVVDDIVKVQEETWDCDFPGLGAQLRSAAEGGAMASAIYCTYLDGAPVGTGRIDFIAGSRFADLHGGAVLERARGRGIYTLLYERRREEALRRGCRYLAVDAAPMSRPILEHKGFVRVCGTYPMRSAPHTRRWRGSRPKK